MLIKIYTIIVITLFYLIYFGKMFIQSRKGIKTNQLGKYKHNKRVVFQEIVLRIITTTIVIVQVISIILNWSLLNTTYRYVGLVIGTLGVIVFFISIVTMRDSWRAGLTDDKTELITKGIYGFSRNPAFLGFDLVYVGVLLSYFSYFLLIVSVIAIVSLHLQILTEEKTLPSVFGEDYKQYFLNVRRCFGKKKTGM